MFSRRYRRLLLGSALLLFCLGVLWWGRSESVVAIAVGFSIALCVAIDLTFTILNRRAHTQRSSRKKV